MQNKQNPAQRGEEGEELDFSCCMLQHLGLRALTPLSLSFHICKSRNYPCLFGPQKSNEVFVAMLESTVNINGPVPPSMIL